MSNNESHTLTPNAEYPYFYHDPEGEGFVYYKTEEERDIGANDAIQQYLEDGWSEDVTNVVTGTLTGQAAMVDKVSKPDDLDDEGCDGEGGYWDQDFDYVCNYVVKPVGFVCPSTLSAETE